MDDGSFTDAAVAPLDGTGSGGIAPSGPGQSLLTKILPQLLPALITGTGLALTSPIKSGPLIAGRALLGGLEGWQQATPSQKDLYYQDRMQREQEKWGQIKRATADRDAYAATITDPDRREAFKINPEKYAEQLMQESGSAENKAYLASIWHVPESVLRSFSPRELHAATTRQMISDHKPHVKAEVQSDGNSVYVARDSAGNIMWTGGAAHSPAPSAPLKVDESIKRKAIEQGVDALNPAEKARWDKMNQHTPTFAEQLKGDPEIAAALGLPNPATAPKPSATQKPTKTLGGKSFEQDTDGQWYEIGQ